MRPAETPGEIGAQARRGLLPGAALGVAIGALAALDFLIANFLHLQVGHTYILRRIPLPASLTGGRLLADGELPGILSTLAVLLAIGLAALLLALGRLWPRRFEILLVLVVASYQMRALLAVGPVDLSDLAVLALLGGWLLHAFTRPDEPFLPGPLTFPVLGLYGAMLLSTTNGGLPALLFMVAATKNLVAFVLLAHLLRDPGRFRLFLKALVVVTFISSLIGFVQEALFLATGTMYVGSIEPRFAHMLLEGGLLRVPGLFGFVQDYAATLTVVVSLVLYLILSPEIRLFARRGWLYVILLSLVGNLILTFSKGALIGAVLAGLLALYLRRPARAIQTTGALLGAGLLAVSLTAALAPSLLRSVAGWVAAQLEYGELRLRLILDAESLRGTLSRHPFIGVGLGLGRKYTAHVFEWPAHNAFLLAFAEVGLVGLALYAATFACVLARLGTVAAGAPDPEQRSLARLLLCGLAALLVFYQVEPFFQLPLTWLYWAMAEGLAGAALRGRHGAPARLAAA